MKWIRVCYSMVLVIAAVLYVDVPQIGRWNGMPMAEMLHFIAFNLIIVGFAIDHALDPQYQGSAFISFAALIELFVYCA